MKVLHRSRLCRVKACITVILLVAVGTAQAQSANPPPADPPPELEEGHSIFALSMSFTSSKLGFSIDVVNAARFLLSENVGIPLEKWVYTHGLVVDSAKLLFLIKLQVVVPTQVASEKEAEAKDFINSGQLDEEFSKLGLVDMQFRVTNAEAGASEVSLSPPTQPDLKELVDEWPSIAEGEEFSQLLDLYVQSPEILFPPVLKDAMLWFIANWTETLTEPASWYMPELAVLNSTRGEYIASLVHVGGENETEAVVEGGAAYVARGGLSQAIGDSGARGVNISVLPKVEVVGAEEEVARDGDEIGVDLLLRMSAPVSGITKEVVAILKASFAAATNTSEGAWWLAYAAPEVEENENGPFMVDVGVVVGKKQRLETVRLVAGVVRSRAVDHALWASGRTDVVVRLRPRLTAFKSNGSGGRAIRSTAATVAASIGGMVVVFAIGAGILCLLPREGNFGPVRSFLGQAEKKSGRVWRFGR
ncbi:unnamed protein product [Agarophyton chilense]